jgi:PilZ domain
LAESGEKSQKDRRARRRAKISARVLVSTVNVGGPFKEIGTSIDASRDGLLFLARYRGYQLGQFVKIVFPYSGSEGEADYQAAEVVRVEPRPDDTVAVAVKFAAAKKRPS